MLLAIDDTDGPEGGCTTYVATLVSSELGSDAMAGLPRLVRLNPDNPWKTRGNAAVVLELEPGLDPDRVLDTALEIVEEHARTCQGKGAGIVVFEQPPDPAWYRRGVTEQVGFDEVRRALEDLPHRTLGTGRGLVGCLCAAAWRPDPQATYTRIAYRTRDRRGSPRRLDEALARRLELSDRSIFDAYDGEDEHPALAPRTPCPVLLGLRATRPDRLVGHVRHLALEPIENATTFVTNQASDDHLVEPVLAPLQVVESAQRLEGGHVRLETRTPRGRSREVVAFEPTGPLRAGLTDAEPGDTLLALGSLKRDGRQVNAEKLLLVPENRTQAPVCPGCGSRMDSVGRALGYRCGRCGTRGPGDDRRPRPRWYEAGASARRHLARPLALGLADPVCRAAHRALESAGQPQGVPDRLARRA